MKKKLAIVALAAILSGACATPHVVEEQKISDADLSCNGLADAIAEAERFKDKARDEKGVTGTNVVAGLFFWPAIIGTYANANEAIEAADDRKRHLQQLREKKDC
ncbi:MAG: hypothetical protein ACR2P4_03570 [Gammaproteobacteria bacterium]